VHIASDAGMNRPVSHTVQCTVVNMSVGLPPILMLMLIYPWCSSRICIKKPYTKYIPTYPEFVGHVMLFSWYHYFSIGNDVSCTWMQYEKAPLHEHTKKWRQKVGNNATWNSSESDVCLHFLLEVISTASFSLPTRLWIILHNWSAGI
jgi:hypothetical protein